MIAGLGLLATALLFAIAYLCDKVASLRREMDRIGQPLCAQGRHTDGPWERQTWAGAETRQCRICGRTEWRLMTGLRYTIQQQQQTPRR